jgi:hypothetical protein
MQRIAAYQAQDGKLFQTPEECLEYEFELKWLPMICEFMQSCFNKYSQGTAMTIAKNVIVAWQRFQVSKDLPPAMDQAITDDIEITLIPEPEEVPVGEDNPVPFDEIRDHFNLQGALMPMES